MCDTHGPLVYLTILEKKRYLYATDKRPNSQRV